MRVAAAPFLSAEGKSVGAVVVMQDITALKQAENTESLLTRELQHRTGNLLAVVQAIAHRTLAGDRSLEEARAGFEARLHALARTHRKLTKSKWTGVSLNEVVRSELEPFAARTRIDGVDLTLSPQHAQNLSLAVHELATNAVKYGALSRSEGYVDISWGVTANGKGNVLKFQWQERGGPAVVRPERHGFGTSLLNAIFAGARIEYAPEGLSCEIDLLM